MLSEALQVISVFLLVPMIVAFFAWRSYRQVIRREREDAAERQREAAAEHKKGQPF